LEVAGGDKSGASSSKEAAGEREDGERNPAVSYIEDQRRNVQDPGDRETPLKRELGDPFDPAINEEHRARRLEGRKISTRTTLGARIGEGFYRVDRYRRFLAKRGATGLGLVEFWGIRASRTYQVDDGPGEWVTDDRRRLHTVEVGSITKIK
jgi:hypothetical protein